LDSLVKERLTGAIILVVLIVLLVPELLSGPSRTAPAPQAAAPSSSTEEPPLRSYTIDLANESRGSTPSAGTSNAPPQPTVQPSTIVEHPAQDPSTGQQPAQTGSPVEVSPQASQQAAQASPPPAVSPPKGPEQPKQSAPPAMERLPVAEKPTPGQQRLAATEKRPTAAERAAADKAGAWVVQVGVFAKQANAERLARDLQEQGFHALVSQNGSTGRTLWWVRAGPVAERAAAEQLSARLRAAGHVGSVVPK
jgi:DedD protein